ncbi:Utr2 protein [Martiniozyma asiatica (nom. inval.)]|nr:Utr2 protein [Martiniozyma asiatica]
MKFSTFALIGSLVVSAAQATSSCSAGNPCPEDYPCCSNDGTCGTGSYCLGPCDPRYSFNSTSCMPAPICKSGLFTPRSDNMMQQVKFLGNTTDTDFIYYGEIEDASEGDDDYLKLKMPQNTTGGVVSSTFYVWYGKVSMKFKTAHYAGVVSAAILFSQVQDEIDFEFVGSQLETAESNFYFEGMLNYTNSANAEISNTYENWHTYTIDWQEDQISWAIDGETFRTLKKDDTYNSTSKIYEYPQTPSRIQLSLWPGGDASNAQGTIEWSGGEIDWDSADFKDPGYVYVGIDTVEVECYDPPSGATNNGNVSYIYNGSGYGQAAVELSDKLTWMSNLGGTGFNTGFLDEGIFNEGIFNEGIFNEGIFNEGIFNEGIFNEGIFNEGIFNEGIFNEGIFNEGIFN